MKGTAHVGEGFTPPEAIHTQFRFFRTGRMNPAPTTHQNSCRVGTGVLDGLLPQLVFVVPVAVPGTLVGVNAFLVCRPLPLAQVASSATGGAPIAPRPEAGPYKDCAIILKYRNYSAN